MTPFFLSVYDILATFSSSVLASLLHFLGKFLAEKLENLNDKNLNICMKVGCFIRIRRCTRILIQKSTSVHFVASICETDLLCLTLPLSEQNWKVFIIVVNVEFQGYRVNILTLKQYINIYIYTYKVCSDNCIT